VSIEQQAAVAAEDSSNQLARTLLIAGAATIAALGVAPSAQADIARAPHAAAAVLADPTLPAPGNHLTAEVPAPGNIFSPVAVHRTAETSTLVHYARYYTAAPNTPDQVVEIVAEISRAELLGGQNIRVASQGGASPEGDYADPYADMNTVTAANQQLATGRGQALINEVKTVSPLHDYDVVVLPGVDHPLTMAQIRDLSGFASEHGYRSINDMVAAYDANQANEAVRKRLAFLPEDRKVTVAVSYDLPLPAAIPGIRESEKIEAQQPHATPQAASEPTIHQEHSGFRLTDIFGLGGIGLAFLKHGGRRSPAPAESEPIPAEKVPVSPTNSGLVGSKS
jgi:hypothetical protein